MITIDNGYNKIVDTFVYNLVYTFVFRITFIG